MNPENSENLEKKHIKNVSAARRILSQFVATTVKNFLLFNSGLCQTFPTIVIAALNGNLNEPNRNEYLSITDEAASWIGSIGYLVQPIGSLISSVMADPIGRKKSMILVNIPFALGWYLLWRATEVWEVFLGFVMLGLSIGLMESSVLTYLGEICEPSVRGTLIGYTYAFGSLAIFLIYLLNTMLAWRTIALVSLAVPIFTAICLCGIPETPQWLLSKNRIKEAKNSLCWLRGWTSREAVADEFNKLKRHSELSKSCNLCIKQNKKCSHPLPTLVDKFQELGRKQTLKPFFIVMALFFQSQFCGVGAMRPFIVQIFKAYKSPIAPDKAVAIMSFIDNIANISFVCLVRFAGKRKMFLVMGAGIFFSSLIITCYGFIYLPSGYTSFNQADEPFHVENSILTYIPIACLFVWSACFFFGYGHLGWMYLSELFGFKSRGVASGIAAALNFTLGFISRKTYLNLETTLSLPGISLFYCIIVISGLILMYFILPETEGRSLEEIEMHFSDNSKKLTDRKIVKNKNKNIQKPMNVENSECDIVNINNFERDVVES